VGRWRSGTAAVYHRRVTEAFDFDRWVAEVRGPAEQSSEGERVLRDGKGLAEARYELSPLPDGRWAIHFSLQHRAGDFAGVAHPWRTFPTREACLAHFREEAMRFFAGPQRRVQGTLQSARAEVLHQLRGEGLFGFIEPNPVPRDGA
jgi:hypothetical protein